jgi:HlyD family secretion protein
VVSSLSASPLFLIGKDMHFMEVDTNVSEADVGGVKSGERSFFTVQAYQNRTFWGTVRQVREGPITVQNVVTYDVVVDVKNDDLALFPGMTADCHIITAERKNVLRVPLPAVRFNPEGYARERPGRGGGAGQGRAAAEHGSEQVSGGAPGSAGQEPGAAVNEHSHGEGAPGGGAGGGAHAGRSGGREAGSAARLWVMRDGKLVPLRVHTGLDDGTLIEVSGDDLKEDDVVVVNAVRPTESHAEQRAGQSNAPGGNNLRGGGGPRF